MNKEMPNWIKVRLPVTKSEAKAIMGKPCKTYERGCYVCDGWKSYNDKGWIHIMLDRADLIKQECGVVTLKENRV